MEAFLTENFSEEKTKILAIIERIAFSREKAWGRNDWLAVLGIDGVIVRNIVSDADKLDAINAHRCYMYQKMKGPSTCPKKNYGRMLFNIATINYFISKINILCHIVERLWLNHYMRK